MIELFLKYLTEDSKTQDARKKDFNQAIFMPNDGGFHAGGQVFNGTDLDMVMEKFDKAVKSYENTTTKSQKKGTGSKS